MKRLILQLNTEDKEGLVFCFTESSIIKAMTTKAALERTGTNMMSVVLIILDHAKQNCRNNTMITPELPK